MKKVNKWVLGVTIAGVAGCSMDYAASMREYSPPPPPGVEPDDPQERYDAPGTNPFVVTSHDRLSTFAADVDTASYDIFRRDVERGVLPDPASVRLEEYINSFTYDYPAPTSTTQPFTITLAAARSPFEETTLVSVGIQGRVVTEERRTANLVFLVDVSGSMEAPNKLPLVKRILLEALEVLEPEDTVAIVTYAGHTSVRLRPTSIAARDAIEDALQGLASGGSTAGAAGLDLAYAEAERGFIPNGINHVLLCTDGDFNVGPSSTAALVELIERKRQTGITLTVLGFGDGNLNDAMMEAVSNAGNGIYGVISSEDQAIAYAHERLLSTFNLIARDVKIQVEMNPELVYAYRLLGYENRALGDDEFRDNRVDAGEVGSGHSVTALYELVLSGDRIPSPEGAPHPLDGPAAGGTSEVSARHLLQVRLRYKGPNATAEDPAEEIDEGLEAVASASALSEASVDLEWAAAVAAFAEILKHSPYAKPEAIETIAALVAGAATDGARLEFAGLFSRARELLPEPR